MFPAQCDFGNHSGPALATWLLARGARGTCLNLELEPQKMRDNELRKLFSGNFVENGQSLEWLHNTRTQAVACNAETRPDKEI